MAMDDAEITDQFIHEALRNASSGVDLDTGGEAVEAALRALLKQAQALQQAEYKTHQVAAKCKACERRTTHTIFAPAPDIVARAASHTAKLVDVIARLMAFAKGQPDSRPDMGGDWLRALDDEQLRTVQGWIAAKGGKA